MKSKYLLIPLTLLKAFFQSVTQVAWGLLSIFGFNFALTYLASKKSIDITDINILFLRCESIIINNAIWFVLIFLILYSYSEIKEILKK